MQGGSCGPAESQQVKCIPADGITSAASLWLGASEPCGLPANGAIRFREVHLFEFVTAAAIAL